MDFYVLKVALVGDKNVWRRIAIRGDQTLDDLHEAIYAAFDRDDPHLYSFYFPTPAERRRRSLREGVEYTHPFNSEEAGPWGEEIASAAQATLDSLGLKPRQVFRYLFDFGDEWWHELTVEQTDAPVEKGKYPRVIEAHGASPPQYPEADE